MESPFQLMKKFTIFTILLTIVVVVVFVQLMAKDGSLGGGSGNVATELDQDGEMKLTLPKSLDVKKSLATNVLGSDGVNDIRSGEQTGYLNNRLGADNEIVREDVKLPRDLEAAPIEDSVVVKNPDYLDPEAFENGGEPVDVTGLGIKGITTQDSEPVARGEVKDFEDQNFAPVPTGNVYLRDEQVQSAGFSSGILEDEPLDGRLFKTIDISDIKDVEVTKTAIKSQDEVLVKVYIFKVGLDTNVSEVYQMLKLRASGGLNINVNETNQFGIASFYMNDPTRTDTAFLTVRISGLIYAFSYPKMYHSQVKNLLQLIQWELG